jgi:hypothetical protein
MSQQQAGGSYLNEVLGCFRHRNSGKFVAAFSFVVESVVILMVRDAARRFIL